MRKGNGSDKKAYLRKSVGSNYENKRHIFKKSCGACVAY